MGLNRTSRNVLAVIIASVPALLLLLWFRQADRSAVTVFEMLAYPLIFGTGLIVLIVLLNKYLCFATLGSLNPGRGNIGRDVLHGLLLFIVFALLTVLEQFTVMRWFPQEGPPPEFQELIRGLTANPLLLAIWLGPVVWIGVALFEELHRVFFLKCLWEVWDRPVAKWIIILISAALSGAVHSYQGIAGVISTGVMGLLAAVYYLKYRRIVPLVVAHAVYDSAWIIFGITMMSS